MTTTSESRLTKKQKKRFGPVFYKDGRDQCAIIAEVRFDDECGNGHNTFSITADIYDSHPRRGESTIKTPEGKTLWMCGGGCCHEEVAKHFPELAPLIKWHLTSTDGPMHYVQNTIYLAGDRDCWGLKQGEFRQHTSRGPNQNNGIEGVPNWVLEIPDRIKRDVYAMEKPEPVVCEWKPYGRTGEGKERELEAARNAAVWPDATDEELTAPGLKERLEARLPALMAEFKAAVESLGFTY